MVIYILPSPLVLSLLYISAFDGQHLEPYNTVRLVLNHLIGNHEPNHSRNVSVCSDRICNVSSVTMDALDNVVSAGENLERNNILTNLFSEPSFISELHFLILFSFSFLYIDIIPWFL